jgi:hypothetical protein
MLTFELSAPARLQFTILSSAPECRRLGMFARKGRIGTNRIQFLGRLHGRALAPGRYTIVPEAVRGRRHHVLATVTIVILSPERRLSPTAVRRPVRAECTSHATGRVGALAELSESSGFSLASIVPFDPSRNRSGNGPANGVEQSGVAGASQTKRLLTSPKDGPVGRLAVPAGVAQDDAPVPPLVLGLLGLAALSFGLLLLLALVLRFMRSTWNP